VGFYPGCASAWHPLRYRLYRIGPSGATTLLDGSHSSYLKHDPPHRARLEQHGFLLEFDDRSIDSGKHNRPNILRYRIESNSARRIEPIALRPGDFVEEWMSRPWAEISEWTATSLKTWHAKMHEELPSGDYDLVQKCAQLKNTWLVGIKLDKPHGTFYFLVQDRGKYRYKVIEISDKRHPGCPGNGLPVSDVPTLFPHMRQ
jgi:hypothetical protein